HVTEPLVEVRRAERDAAAEEAALDAGFPAQRALGVEVRVPAHEALGVVLEERGFLERGAGGGAEQRAGRVDARAGAPGRERAEPLVVLDARAADQRGGRGRPHHQLREAAARVAIVRAGGLERAE